MKKYKNIDQLRSYSTIFSGTSFLQLINQNDYTFIDKKIERFDHKFIGKSYLSYIKYIYKVLSQNYRCEYVYKNLIINELLIERYKLQNTIAINEFKVGSSIADIAMFNGNSKAFEIKTELDSSKRLNSQLDDYKKLFNECYIVTHESLVEKYLQTDEEIGVLALYQNNNQISLEEIRKPQQNSNISPDTLMRCLRTNEYKAIIKKHYGCIPNVNSFQMFDNCHSLLKEIPQAALQKLFLETIKTRLVDKSILSSCQKELKQICLSLGLNSNTYPILNDRLNQQIQF